MTTHAPSPRDVAPVRHVLCPVDFSSFSRRAMEEAVPIAQAFGADMTALFVYPLEPSVAGEADTGAVIPDEGARSAVAADLGPFLQPARAAGVRASVSQRAGDPVAAILEEARRTGAGLIAMGTHGRSGLERLVLGSVADEVLRRAACPVLTVARPGASQPPPGGSRILCAVDLTPASARTMETALAYGKALGAPVTLLHVVEPAGSDEATWARRGEARERLHDLAARAGQWAFQEETVVAGRSHVEILRLAAERRVSLIVIGTHSTHDMERALCGSTADQVVREARCPVLTVRGPAAAGSSEMSRSSQTVEPLAR